MLRISLVAAMLVFCVSLQAETHTVISSGLTFNPASLIINSGDSVRWENQGGFHNAVHLGFPPAFTSGAPSSANWVLIHHFTDTELTLYTYVCEVHQAQGMVGAVTVLAPSAVGDQPLPQSFSLSEAYPNPFNAVSHIELNLPASSQVTLDVFNNLGQKVARVFDGVAVAGSHRFALDGSDWSSGLYFVRASALGQTAFKKAVLLK